MANQFMENMPSILGSVGQTYSAIKSFQTDDINYDILNLQADIKEQEAKALEIEVQQEANFLREQFAEAVGSFQAATARRGVKVGEGSAQQNVEMSSKELGEDIKTSKENARFKGDQVRAEADQLRSAAKGAKEIGKWEAIGNAAKASGKINTALNNMGLYGQQENDSGSIEIEDTKDATRKKTKFGLGSLSFN